MHRENPFVKIRARTVFYWSLLGIILLFISAFFIGVIIGLLNLKINFSRFNNLDATTELAIGSVFTYGFIWFWCWKQKKRSSLNYSYLFGRLPHPRHWLPFLLLNIPILLFSLGTGEFIFYLLYLYKPDLLARLFLAESSSDRPLLYHLVYFVILVIIAPLFEEVFFRGFLFQRLATKWGNGTAIVLSSIIFGLLHFNPVGLFFFSVVMTLVYIRTRCLWIPIIMHAINNLCAVLIQLFSSSSSSQIKTIDLEIFQNAWQTSLIYIILALPLLMLFIVKNWTKKQQLIPYLANYS